MVGYVVLGMVIYGLLGITGNQHIHMYIYDEMLDKMQRTDLDIFKPLSLNYIFP